MKPWGATVLMDLKDDYKFSHLEVDCSGQIPCRVDLPKAIEFFTGKKMKFTDTSAP